MSKISEQKALEAYPIKIRHSMDSNRNYRDGYIKGYDQAMQDFMEKACTFLKNRTMAKFALQNQWISVDEELSEDIPNCFVAYKAMDMVLYSTGSYEKDNKEWYVDGVGFNAEVTHYMPIPNLKGGE